MNPEVKAKWLEALRSGEYQQGTGRLCKKSGEDYRFCCLGVLCDIHTIETNQGEFVEYDNHKCLSYRDDTSVGGTSMPTRRVMRWSGIQTNNLSHVAVRNDRGDSFEKIADYIEENF